MQTRCIFVGLNDPDISTDPKHFILLASQKITFFPDIAGFAAIRVPTFLSLSVDSRCYFDQLFCFFWQARDL